jgi:Tol biopolymer transport system component
MLTTSIAPATMATVLLLGAFVPSSAPAATDQRAAVRQAAAPNGGFATQQQIITVGGEQRVAPWPIDTEGGSFSPDGRALAWYTYTVRRDRDYQALWVTDPSGSREVAVLDFIAGIPSWAPDGRRVVVAGQRTNNQLSSVFSVSIIPVDGSGPPVEIFKGRDTEAWTGVAWSPDGTRIAFVRSMRDIFTYDLATGLIHQVTRGCVWDAPVEDDETGPSCATYYGFDGAVTWSPDGTRLAAVSRKSVVVVDAVTGAVTPLVSTKQWLRNALWSPDGAWIAYGVFGGGSLRVPVAGGVAEPISSTVVSSWQPCPTGSCATFGAPRARSRILLRPRVSGQWLRIEGKVVPTSDRESWREELRAVLRVRNDGRWRRVRVIDPLRVDQSAFSRKVRLPEGEKCRLSVVYAGGWTRTPSRVVKTFAC